MKAFLPLMAAVALATATPGSAADGPCSAAPHRHFDFWIGSWDVYAAETKQLAGHNRIERVHGGCALQENWTGARGYIGSSVNFYDPADGLWHQLWRDNTGLTLRLAGGFADGRMRLYGFGPAGSEPPLLHRITWQPIGSGRVRQHWQSSKDWGETWSTEFDGLYLPPGEKP